MLWKIRVPLVLVLFSMLALPFEIPGSNGGVSASQLPCPKPLERPELAKAQVVTRDHAVSHISTVPANKDQPVCLFVRERVASNRAPGKAVLMIHGASVPVLAGFELRTDHYDWALWLAQAGGFDVFMLDFQGSGLSPRPKMDDPCNVGPAQRSILNPNPLSHLPPCPSPTQASYPFQLINSQSDWAELDTVVDYIRRIRGVEKVALVSWSQGSLRTGPYAVQHPDKVDSLLFLAPIYDPAGRAGSGTDGFGAPVSLPQPGTPLTLATRIGLMGDQGTWGREIKLGQEMQCADQVEDGIQDVVWNAIMDNDPIGRTWGPGDPPEGVMRVRSPFLWGWNSATASKLEVPVLIIYGELDTNPNARPDELYAAITNDTITIPNPDTLLFKVQCAGHFMVWERQRRVLHHISKQWLQHGAVEQFTNGRFLVDTEGNLISQ